MIYGITKFKVATRDWPYVVEFSNMNDGTHEGELITHRTNNRPRPALIETAHKVASLALRMSGMGLVVEATEKRKLLGKESVLFGYEVGYGLASITWSEGDDPGTKVEIHLVGQRPLHKTSERTDMKLFLEKIDSREEYHDVDLGGGLKERRPVPTSESVKNAYIEAVKLPQDQVKAFAEGETEQGELFSKPRETAGATR